MSSARRLASLKSASVGECACPRFGAGFVVPLTFPRNTAASRCIIVHRNTLKRTCLAPRRDIPMKWRRNALRRAPLPLTAMHKWATSPRNHGEFAERPGGLRFAGEGLVVSTVDRPVASAQFPEFQGKYREFRPNLHPQG